ncbi:MAG: hypothetical protein CBB87_01435 [Micavibrio sp. TMED27]|nr:hypothetical protein [Micavibrio sp.]OUT92432.1 MAG: hypothetical protein CBB87_01435 [Micavibrio sp. TMED27]|tara:strand:+ start:2826 stop:4835 length:2010 start_codon:yes stop_codon:yes gene_type:complete
MLARSYYQDDIADFLKADPDKVLGELAHNHHFALDISQKNAWLEQIDNLKHQLSKSYDGQIFFEFSIPRMGKRVDVVLLIHDIVFVLEYKAGAKQHDKHAIDQALDYALDLKNFHEGSHDRYIVPILVSTKAAKRANEINWYDDKVATPFLCNGADLDEVISQILSDLKSLIVQPAYGFSDNEQDPFSEEWAYSGYKPTPTIVEAAQALYQGHNVEEISRSDAGAKNLTHTSNCISEVIEYSKHNRKKSICFVTGVPGAGKTLAGLNISTRTVDASSEEHAVFLSGNGPLVSVLREALARDEVTRSKEAGRSVSKKEAAQKVSAFIQNIHHFRDEGLKSDKAPNEHVVIFDEAQRAWNQEHAERFMVQKRGASQFDMSEPEFLISLMDRREDWGTIVCLIGGGQEINTGEAGLIEWFNALQKSFPHWDVYHSGQLSNKNYNWGEDLGAKLGDLNAIEKTALHLSVSIRSFRAEKLSAFVGAIIDGDADEAALIQKDLSEYHLALTRDLDKARSWLRKHARGTERLGLVASSGAMRLKPEGIHVKSKIDPANWFLNGKEDIRSSYYLEDIATEFDIQGLELDWTGLCWDADLRMEGDEWAYYNFKGTKWQNINDRYRRVYLANAYRVLLTRARQGMVIFVPHGDDHDHTRPSQFYDDTYQFLKRCGIQEM